MQDIALAQSVIIKSSCQKFRSYFTFSVCLTYCTQRKIIQNVEKMMKLVTLDFVIFGDVDFNISLPNINCIALLGLFSFINILWSLLKYNSGYMITY